MYLSHPIRLGMDLSQELVEERRRGPTLAWSLSVTESLVLFLDEPTTGLDAYIAYIAVLRWRMLTFFYYSLSSDGECIIVLSIHQPQYSIYKLFDTITLLSKGQLVYHGSTENCLSNFPALHRNLHEVVKLLRGD